MSGRSVGMNADMIPGFVAAMQRDQRVRCCSIHGLPNGHAVRCTLLEDHPMPHMFAIEWDDPELDGSEG